LLEETRADAQAAHDDSLLASTRVIAARRALADGRYDDAEREAAALVGSTWNAETAREHASLWLTLLRAQVGARRLPAAAATAKAADAWARTNATAPARLFASLIAAEYSAARQENNSARSAYEDALALAEAGRVPEDVLAVSDAYAGWLIERGDLARATP